MKTHTNTGGDKATVSCFCKIINKVKEQREKIRGKNRLIANSEARRWLDERATDGKYYDMRREFEIFSDGSVAAYDGYVCRYHIYVGEEAKRIADGHMPKSLFYSKNDRWKN